ncbi:MAG: phosphoribosyltransferase [Candidatus Altiarchaeum hamiconexum]|uniref:Phosphoribosyltransferase n=1 Tax=Candidatus Altarchaeum hamiconexum TaxID=1803513 RepID=A0A8J7YVI7_9ARCH|nr:phosphoribosyltransferase [Candidatus Altarchaeum hamiconexum]OIQ04658.1 MAG: hypothetical protein AUK59_06900 [Candidatus Altarchaeum sp. CG2_30_32_3053]PIN67207.1 MAG: phosphoribosyltransferase [Candidatus Altarchaeum sp. CG12_big_fil_rev_8_21_14_0_65_33_22]PIV28130.1 MAG: phosphoribosyltransferase [Candidatus Altarchaeum sp. CG03_land_8_20_14_0_80_32_618]PIX48329.1 MAG: phosphoribosyltransferase [Candidatus Altarchaeum sp. CG_4_8_14_3_um_filter_33_2054]PIZ30950.1 MAG: phosphoribosyltrans
MKFRKVSWDEIEEGCIILYEKTERNFKFDCILAICRGGWIPVRIISDLSAVKDVGNLRIESYDVYDKNEAKITQDVSVDVKDKNVLLVDDIADTGDSLILAKKYLLKKFPKNLMTATLHCKVTSKIRPDFFVKETDADTWIIYPWEKRETERKLKNEGILI